MDRCDAHRNSLKRTGKALFLTILQITKNRVSFSINLFSKQIAERYIIIIIIIIILTNIYLFIFYTHVALTLMINS